MSSKSQAQRKRFSFAFLGALALALLPVSATANDWEKFYRPWMDVHPAPSPTPPEIIPSSGDADQDLDRMWRRGFAPLGISSFESNNANTTDAVRLAKKLGARYLIIATDLASSTTTAMPWTMPKTTTSVTNGNASVQGAGGTASGTYSGTTTTYGSETTYMPITINRFNKLAVYFTEAPKQGLGIYSRELTHTDIAAVETRRALAVRFVRDGSPAYISDVLPGDIITMVEGVPFGKPELDSAIAKRTPFKITVYRNGQYRDVTVTIPAEWIPSTN